MNSRVFGPVVSLVCVLLAGAPPAASGIATSITLPEPAFRGPVIQRMEGVEPRFELQLTREMPSPGWRFEIESVHVEEGRIYVEINEVAPDGLVSDVMTKTRCAIPIDALAPGRYSVELWLRRNGKGEHHLAQALVLMAR